MIRMTGMLILVLCFSHGIVAAELRAYDAVYQSKLKGFDVRVKRRLEIQDSGITVSVNAKRFMFGIYERSRLKYGEDGRLYPIDYVHDRKGLGNEHDKKLVFDWQNGTVIDLLEPDREPLAVEKPCYDKLSYQTQMRLDLLHDSALRHIEYCVTNGIRNRTYSFDRLDEEVLHTKAGAFNTIKFERTGDDDRRQVFVWVAPDWDFLLVRIDQTKEPGDETERLILRNIKMADRKTEDLPSGLSE